jgi:hypothetical protein
MNDEAKILRYATPKRWQLPAWVYVVLLLVWPFAVLGVYGMAVIGPVMTGVLTINLVHPLPGFRFYRELAPSAGKQIEWILFYAALSAVFVLLTVAHVRWSRRVKRESARRRDFPENQRG